MNRKDLANGILALGVNATDTTWVLQNGYGAGMPPVPFYLTATPFGQLPTLGNSEIVNVTARSGDTLTLTRGAKGTTAKAFQAGAVVANAIYADEKWGSDNIDWATFPFEVTGLYSRFYTSPNRTGAAGSSYERTVNLPRTRQSDEQVILIPDVQRWCTVQITSIGTTNFTYQEHNTINTSGMVSGFSAIYFKAR